MTSRSQLKVSSSSKETERNEVTSKESQLEAFQTEEVTVSINCVTRHLHKDADFEATYFHLNSVTTYYNKILMF